MSPLESVIVLLRVVGSTKYSNPIEFLFHSVFVSEEKSIYKLWNQTTNLVWPIRRWVRSGSVNGFTPHLATTSAERFESKAHVTVEPLNYECNHSPCHTLLYAVAKWFRSWSQRHPVNMCIHSSLEFGPRWRSLGVRNTNKNLSTIESISEIDLRFP